MSNLTRLNFKSRFSFAVCRSDQMEQLGLCKKIKLGQEADKDNMILKNFVNLVSAVI